MEKFTPNTVPDHLSQTHLAPSTPSALGHRGGQVRLCPAGQGHSSGHICAPCCLAPCWLRPLPSPTLPQAQSGNAWDSQPKDA